ncbi:hypothetical protein Tco_0702237 [Tanacetum coccineum]|uniref:RNA-directed DNA polymerase, eukaryota n=1 Tax=Tanacetum coccineum TaxID=301880 RepID=A0ABQ4XW86_9ASTR
MIDSNAMTKLMKKMKHLKEKIHKGEGDSDVLNKHMSVSKSLQELDKLESMEVAQKAKIKWAIEGNENSKYYYGILNKKRSQLTIRDMDFPNKPNLDQQVDLENNVTREEIKRAVWDCGADKSPSPDGFTFGLYRRYWSFLGKDVKEVVFYFFQYETFPKGVQRVVDGDMFKDKGGLGVSSFHALNRALSFKWVWRFRTQGSSLWARVIKGIHGEDGKLEPGDPDLDVPVAETFHEQTDDELTNKEVKQIEADDQAIQTILMGLPEDIYAAVDSCETAQEI